MRTEVVDDWSAVVVGASRGIGLALVQELLEASPHTLVLATHRGDAPGEGLRQLVERHPGRLTLQALDLCRDEDLDRLDDRLGQLSRAPDLVLHCAGILHGKGLAPEKALAEARREPLLRLFELNSIGPLLVARKVLPHLPRRRPAHFVALSAMVGSIGDNRLGGWYGYRASKAALNQFMKTLAIECRRSHPGLCVTAMHPGTTDTDLSRPFQGNVPPAKLYAPQRTARRIMAVTRAASADDSGRFVNWTGEPIPW